MKNYEEIAKNVFKRRDEYIAEQKRKKRIIISIVTPTICALIITGLGFWENGIFNHFSANDGSQNDFISSEDCLSGKTNQNNEIDNESFEENNSTNVNFSSKPSNNNGKGIEDKNEQTKEDPSQPSTNNVTSEPSVDIPPETFIEDSSVITPSTPPVTQGNFIDSIDKMNFYAAKKAINDNSLLPMDMNLKSAANLNVLPLNYSYAQYPIDRYKVFTLTMVTYFTIKLNDEKGFLAQKLGGTGLIEVVVTRNDIDEMGAMITFKRGNKYYSCLKNRESRDPASNTSRIEFSSHKYINGFNLVKNLEQENYQFNVYYEDSKVVGFECKPWGSVPAAYAVDDITFVNDFCVVIFTKHTFTIDQLEIYFKEESEEIL